MGIKTVKVFLEKHTELSWRTSRYSKSMKTTGKCLDDTHIDRKGVLHYILREVKILCVIVRDTVYS